MLIIKFFTNLGSSANYKFLKFGLTIIDIHMMMMST